MKLKTILKTAELEHLADIEREGDGIAIVMQFNDSHHPEPIETKWNLAARVNLAQSIRRIK